ncbi:MAG TPA: hypothetical protein DEB06_07375 [Phycisphaerales bacterium]|nr:hypothetical protein [Phycisphaerales bacterium]
MTPAPPHEDPGPGPGRNALSRLDRPLPGPQGRPLRVGLHQPALPKYRVPVFREFASRDGIDLELSYGVEPFIANVPPDGFRATERAPLRLLGRIWWYAGQFRLADPSRFDVAIFPWNTRILSLVPALIVARLRGVATVVWGHGYSKNESSLRRWIRLRMGLLADCQLFYNYGTAQQMIRLGAPRNRVFVALNCLDQAPIERAQDAWRAQPGRLDAWRRDQGVDPRRTLLFVSRLDPANRVDLLLRAAAALRARFPDLLVAIVGKGDDEPRLRALAGELGLGSTVRFVGAEYEEDRLAPWFLSARAFCYPANIGLSILHAFGYGLPVVTSDNFSGQNPEIEALRHEVNGLTYTDASVEALAAALERLLRDDDLHGRLSAGARETVREAFSLSWMVDGLEAAARRAYARRALKAR